jgi:Leucine-rich repeat (LRR) protein
MQFFKVVISSFIMLLTIASFAQERIDLSYQNLDKLPDNLKTNQVLEELILTGNPLKSLPEWLGDLPQLQIIVLDEITTLPVSASFQILSNCSTLKYLSWKKGKLVYIPVAINDFQKLIQLNLSDNGIVKLPLIKKDIKITELDLSKNLIDSLGSSILAFKKLHLFNFSFNPGVNNDNNYHLLKNLEQLSSLKIMGLRKFPDKICKLPSLISLDISNSKLEQLPENFKLLHKLEHLNMYNCKALDFPVTVEQLAKLTSLTSLIIGGRALNKIPFNIFKLRALSSLTIQNSCMEYFPTSIKRLNVSKLALEHCSVKTGARFFENTSGMTRLKSLHISNLVCQDIQLKGFLFLDSLDVSHCQLTKLPSSLNNLKWINLSGNTIAREQLKHLKGEIIGSGNYKRITVSSNIKHKTGTVTHVPFRKTIYTQIGEIFLVNGVRIEVPPYAFINNKSVVIDGEVVLSVNIIKKPNDIALLDKTLNSERTSVVTPLFLVEIKAYQQLPNVKGEDLEREEVFINQKNALTISIATERQNQATGFRYDERKKYWVPLETSSEYCNPKQQAITSKSFKSIVFSDLNQYPSTSFNVRSSKVQIKLKRNKRRNTLKFEITPEYGYKENFFQLFGDRIKGYPELKVFKKVKWNYVGDSVENVLERLYFLSEKAKSEKLKRKSTFYFYVLDIKNITIKPHPEKDNYVMSILQGKDTLQLNVLPKLSSMNAHKIQKWHKKKYKKYSKKLEERLLYWNKLDSLHLNYFSSFEKKLSKFRLRAIENEKAVATHSIKSTNKNRLDNYKVSFKVGKTGWYQIGEELIVDSVKTTALKLKISGRNHYAKYVLIRNPANNQTYWQPTRKVIISEIGQNYIYSKVGQNTYVGKYTGSQTVQLKRQLKED